MDEERCYQDELENVFTPRSNAVPGQVGLELQMKSISGQQEMVLRGFRMSASVKNGEKRGLSG